MIFMTLSSPPSTPEPVPEVTEVEAADEIFQEPTIGETESELPSDLLSSQPSILAASILKSVFDRCVLEDVNTF